MCVWRDHSLLVDSGEEKAEDGPLISRVRNLHVIRCLLSSPVVSTYAVDLSEPEHQWLEVTTEVLRL